jgi:hypothetical protein
MMRKINRQIYDWLVASGVGHVPPFDDEAIRAWGMQAENVVAHYASYLASIHEPGSPGPIEKHPYIERYPDAFALGRSTLLLGTFPPSTHLNGLHLPAPPNPNMGANVPIPFFYGNMATLWNYLFGLVGDQLIVAAIQAKLTEFDIGISDVFSFVQRLKMISSKDSDLRNIIVNRSIEGIFDPVSMVDTVLFTSGTVGGLTQDTVSTLSGFKWILQDWYNEHHIPVEISGSLNGQGQYFPLNPNGINAFALAPIMAEQDGGIVWWLRTNNKQLRIVNLPSPSAGANINMYGSAFFAKWIAYKALENDIPPPNQHQLNNLVELYLPLFPNVFGAGENVLSQYRREVYGMVLNDTIHLI